MKAGSAVRRSVSSVPPWFGRPSVVRTDGCQSITVAWPASFAFSPGWSTRSRSARLRNCRICAHSSTCQTWPVWSQWSRASCGV